MASIQKIKPCLWFDGKALEAAQFYGSLFPDSAISSAPPGPGGVPMVVMFKLAGQEFMGLNGGPMFTFNEAVSFFVQCDDQAEIDRLWSALTADGGEPSRCGWLKDRYGLSWQIIPAELTRLMSGPDPAASGRVMQALMGMSKIDIAALQRAAQ